MIPRQVVLTPNTILLPALEVISQIVAKRGIDVEESLDRELYTSARDKEIAIRKGKLRRKSQSVIHK